MEGRGAEGGKGGGGEGRSKRGEPDRSRLTKFS